MSEKIALFDMDGTLFDYEGAIRKELCKMQSPGDPDMSNLNLWDEGHGWLYHRIRLIKKQAGFWRNLPKFMTGWHVLKICKDLGFSIHILTKGPSSMPEAWMEKVQCIKDHFRNDVTIHCTEDKGIHYGRVLVDDYPEYIEKWLKHRPRGLVLMPAHPYNADYTHPNVIRVEPNPAYDWEVDDVDLNNEQQIRTALAAVFNRSASQHWKELCPS